MSKSRKAVRSVVIIIIFTLGSKILGFIREMLIAAKFGSGFETDTFFIALTTVSLFRVMITKSINTTMIPVLSEIESKEGKEGKRKHANNLLNIIMLVSLLIIAISWIMSPFLIRIVASGFKGKQFDLAVLLTRIGLPAIFFASVQGVFRGYLQSEMMFTESAAADIPFNFVYIFFLIFLTGSFGIKGLMVTSVLAVASQILIQIPGVRSIGYKHSFTMDFEDRYVKKMLYLIPPILVSAGISDLNKIIDRSLASTLTAGSISALNYSNRLGGLVTGVFVSAITTVMYPMFSQEANKGTYDGLKKAIIQGVNVVLIITIPATIGMIVLANPIVKVAFERGAFDANATYMTAGALVFYAVGLVGRAVRSVLHKVYYSVQDTKTPMVNGAIAVVVNIVLNFILVKFMAHKGLALATSISAIVTALLLLYDLRKKIGSFGFTKSIICGLKSLVASVIMGIVVYFLDINLINYMGNSVISELLALLASAGSGLIVYSILIYLFKVEEVNWIIRSVKDRLSIKK